MKRLSKFLPLLLLAMLQACGSDDNAEPPAELVDFKPEARLEEQWSASPTAGIAQQYLFLEPLLLGDKLVIAGRDGRVAVIDTHNGEILRELDLQIELSAGVGGDDKLWLLASRDGEVLAIEADGLAVKWRKAVPSEVLSTPLLAGDSVIVRTVDGHVQSLDAADGSLSWSYDKALPALTLRGVGKPVLTREHVVVGLENGHLVALRRDNGQPLWDAALSVPKGRSEIQRLVDIDGNAELYGRLLYAVGFQGRIAAIDVTSGQFVWARSFSSETGVSVGENAVYVTDERGHIWALDRFNGATLWKQDALTARRVTRPVIFGDTLLVGDYAGVLHAIDLADGHFIARETIGDEDNGIFIPPLVHDEQIIVNLRNGDVHALTLQSLTTPASAGRP